jgi:hypothetical protein
MKEHPKKPYLLSELRNCDSESESSGVGYCRPPKHSQFKPGKSGNPMGRRAGSRNLKSVRKELYTQLVPVRFAGKHKMLPLISALDAVLINRALKGDEKAIRTALANAKELGVFDFPASKSDELTRQEIAQMTQEEVELILRAEEITQQYKAKRK